MTCLWTTLKRFCEAILSVFMCGYKRARLNSRDAVPSVLTPENGLELPVPVYRPQQGELRMEPVLPPSAPLPPPPSSPQPCHTKRRPTPPPKPKRRNL
ncbi:uncharacterized protein LOC126354743 isoform X2 [Schistocerca gregaria]|uniref:uncharacterized protein LOC126354743 isoform X2 n=1 Tax=Schistocerca gregaria TaxID=7010 RepID=UPI00211F3044|nr:uncharacterized protein LOC126354743 isoform X2 [Schistocerca gregaria]